jgi:hypothetical protein
VRWSISALVIAGFFFVLWKLLGVEASALDKMGNIQNVMFTLLGALGAAFTQVMNYWFGSSKGSSDKTQILNQQLSNLPAAGGPGVGGAGPPAGNPVAPVNR